MHPPASPPVRFDDFELDADNALLTRSGRAVPLPPKAFALLCELARHSGQLTKKEALLDAVWGHRHVSESVLKTTVSQLRSALADDPAQPRYIETVSRLGYRFIGKPGAPVVAAAAATMYAEPPAQRSCIIGRKGPLARLHKSWQDVLAGQRRLVWVVGDPGIGKTTLIDEFVRGLPGMNVMRGQCIDQYGAGEPYRPILEALSALCRRQPGLLQLMRSVAPTWLVQFPWLTSEADRDVLQRELAGVHQDRMVRELDELLKQCTQDWPLLLITEDLHWSDQATLRLMDHFARRREPMRLLWLASFRLTQVLAEDHPLKPLRQELRLHRLYEEVALESFSQSEVADYIAGRVANEPVPEEFARRLHVHTDGLPLFVANVIDTLAARHEDEASPRWLRDSVYAPLPIPDSLVGAIERQISQLPADTRLLLEAASVCGMEFRTSTLAVVLEKDPDAVSYSCDRLARDQFWLRDAQVLDLPDGSLDTRVVFRHALYQHVFYGRIGTSQRALYHRRVAQSIEQGRAGGSATAAELASHYERGHAYTLALRHYVQAAQSALAHFAPLEAAKLTEHALTLLPRCTDEAERMELELALCAPRGLAYSQLDGVASPGSVAAFERARVLCGMLPRTAERALLLNGLGWVLYTRGEYGETLSLGKDLEVVATAHGNLLLSVCACTLQGIVLATYGEHAAACEYLERGIAGCKDLGDRIPVAPFLLDPEVSMRTIICIPLMALGRVDEARMQAAAAIARAERLGQPVALALSHKCASQIEVRLESPERAAVLLKRMEEVVATSGLAQPTGPLRWMKGCVESLLGDAMQGHAGIVEGLGRYVEMGMCSQSSEVLGYAAEAQLRAGHLDEAEKHIEAALRFAEQYRETVVLPCLLLIQGRIALARGDAAAARVAMRASLEEARRREALTFQLQALVALASLDRTQEHLAALQRVCDSMQGGSDTKSYVAARRLLAAFGAPSGAATQTEIRP